MSKNTEKLSALAEVVGDIGLAAALQTIADGKEIDTKEANGEALAALIRANTDEIKKKNNGKNNR